MSIGFDVGNLFKEGMEKLKEEFNLDENYSISLDRLFPPSFMEKHTQYKTIGEMTDACNADANTDEWNEHVKKTTKFSSWEDMSSAGFDLLRKENPPH